ncbi:hypothetical protein L7F22_044370 [Adiantum nelumboides]|nr:hypothetical protein [Adiantum nelumboides]
MYKRCVFIDDEAQVDEDSNNIEDDTSFTEYLHHNNEDDSDDSGQEEGDGGEEKKQSGHLGRHVSLGLMKDVLSQFYVKKRIVPPPVPLCRLVVHEAIRAHVTPNIAHEVYMFQKFGLANKESILNRLTLDMREWAKVEMTVKTRYYHGASPWYNTPCGLISQLVWKDEFNAFMSKKIAKVDALGLNDLEKKKRKKILLHLMSLTKSKDPQYPHFGDYKLFRGYMKKEIYWAHLNGEATLLIERLQVEGPQLPNSSTKEFYKMSMKNHIVQAFPHLIDAVRSSDTSEKMPNLMFSTKWVIYRWIVQCIEEKVLDAKPMFTTEWINVGFKKESNEYVEGVLEESVFQVFHEGTLVTIESGSQATPLANNALDKGKGPTKPPAQKTNLYSKAGVPCCEVARLIFEDFPMSLLVDGLGSTPSEALSRKAKGPILELREGSAKRPRQEDREELENIQADSLPSSPKSVPPTPSSKTPPSPKSPELQKSPPAPSSSQQQQYSDEPTLVPLSSQPQDKQEDQPKDKADLVVKQADTTKPRSVDTKL